MSRVYRKKSIPFLAEKMKYKQATNETLAEASGVSEHTIQKARRGEAVLFMLADCIIQALDEGIFRYKKRGPKNGVRRNKCHL